METKHLKSYAPKARRQFIDSISKRAAQLGITKSGISDIQISGSSAVIEGRAYTKKQGEQRNRLAKVVQEKGYELFIRETAYTWFNRLIAIRYMEIHDYLEHGYRVLSHPNKVGEKPEILMHASDVAERLSLNKEYIVDLQLDGNKDEELYRLILVGQCNYLNSIMPFMFEAVDGASELLLPDNLTKTDSILHDLITDVPENDLQEIESIGWLYQFYISEYKDSVMGKVVKSEDIPAATQLFTPNWIVKYLVENSLGRQWLATYPKSPLKDKMDYYIEPAEQSEDVIAQLKACTPTEINPEEIKVLDPACGSGHILVEAYDILKQIYTERLYRTRDIPSLILNKNIFGLDIDIRAAQLANFALLMKARADDPLIFDKIQSGKVVLNVHSIESTEHFDSKELWSQLNLFNKQKKGASLGLLFDIEKEDEMSGESREVFETFQYMLTSFKQAKTLGSLIEIDNNKLTSILKLRDMILTKISDSDSISRAAGERLLSIVQQCIVLAYKYDAVIANPPYMGGKGMNFELKDFAKLNFPNSKSDLFSIFMERAFKFLNSTGLNAQVNMQAWMFLSSYEKLREWILDTKTLLTMAHLGARAFGQISGEVVQTSAWIISNKQTDLYQPTIFRLTVGNEEAKRKMLLKKENSFFKTNQDDFKLIPGSQLAYWMDEELFTAFKENNYLESIADTCSGMSTTDNVQFLRYWWEVHADNLAININNADDSLKAKQKWYFYSKGGNYRKWYGNNEFVVNWKSNGRDIRACIASDPAKQVGGRIVNEDRYFLPGTSWSDLTSGRVSARVQPSGCLFDSVNPVAFSKDCNKRTDLFILGFLNSSVVNYLSKVINPTLHFTPGNARNIPLPKSFSSFDVSLVENCISASKSDWDSFEVSKDFKCPPIIRIVNEKVEASYNQLLRLNDDRISFFSKNEKLINEFFNSKYCVNGDADYENNHIYTSLLCNPFFRYKSENTDLIKMRYQSDAFVELIQYAIGCMMGRYCIEKDGLMFAHSANSDFNEIISASSSSLFKTDDDGIVPLASEEWIFDDDATIRIQEFIKIVWGVENLNINIDFVAKSLSLHAIKPNKSETSISTIRRYLSTQFYKDHCNIYKKRPIYWLFSSGKERAFECLVYLHRYNDGTLARMRTEYVTPLMGKYDNELTRLRNEEVHANGADLRKIEKDIASVQKKQVELRAFDEQLKHYADMRISLDLDDGVKANYGKFGTLLADVKSIHGKG